jgi:hypothetical protein
VAITANVENVKHFAVDTPFLVAVVKGTKFTVTSGSTNSQVDVTRGKVGVEDLADRTFVDVLAGQHARDGAGQPLSVGGSGVLQPITDAKGKTVSVVTASGEVADLNDKATSGSDQSGSDNNGKDKIDGNGGDLGSSGNGNGKGKGAD